MDDPFGLWLVEGILLILVFLFSLAHTALKNANENKLTDFSKYLPEVTLINSGAEAAKEALRAKYPSLCLCGTHHGYFDKSSDSLENQAILSLVRRTRPDLLFVCFGAPAQERWISENAEEIPSLRLCMGLGGALDVWSGSVRRAPKFIQKCGFEWLWRALSEPKRFPRLLAIPKFLLAVRGRNRK